MAKVKCTNAEACKKESKEILGGGVACRHSVEHTHDKLCLTKCPKKSGTKCVEAPDGI